MSSLVLVALGPLQVLHGRSMDVFVVKIIDGGVDEADDRLNLSLVVRYAGSVVEDG